MGSERTAVVTGASQGIGREIARSLAAGGYRVWAVARRHSALAQLANPDDAGVIIPAACDLTDAEAVDRLVEQIITRTPRIDALVHCAGTITHGTVAQTDSAPLVEQFASNVESAYRLTRLVLPSLVPGSSIVFLNSSQGNRAAARTSHYAASMHARRAIADSLRDEVNERGIRVTSVYPGRTATPRQQAMYDDNAWEYRPELLLQPTDIAAVVATIVGLPATAEVTDIHIRPAIKSY